jgi:hypothetical protein
MQLPNWFKIIWWFFLIVVVAYYLSQRYSALGAGHASPPDVFVFLVWVALCLIPFFQEINLFGLKFHQEMTALKEHVDERINHLQNDIRNSIDIRSQINPQFTVGIPPTDAQLPAIEERVRATIVAEFQKRGASFSPPPAQQMIVEDERISFLLAARYNIEKELRRLSSKYLDLPAQRGINFSRQIADLTDNEIIDRPLSNAIRQVYLVCSTAIHGRDVTEAQIKFVHETAPGLIAALKAIG